MSKTYKVLVQCLADVMVEVEAISDERAAEMACEVTQNMLLGNCEQVEIEGYLWHKKWHELPSPITAEAWVEEVVNPLVTTVTEIKESEVTQ